MSYELLLVVLEVAVELNVVHHEDCCEYIDTRSALRSAAFVIEVAFEALFSSPFAPERSSFDSRFFQIA